MKNWIRKPWIVLTTWFIFIFFMVVILPAVVLQTEAIGITESIDTNFSFQANEIYRIIGSYGVDGRSYYLLQRWTFDLVWPLAYGLPLFATLRLFLPQVLNQRWGFISKLPLLAVGLDYLENIIFSIIVVAYPNEFTWLAFVGVSVSLLKWLTLSGAMLLTIAISLWAFMKFLKTLLTKQTLTK
jgi:hypothetical protein